MSCPNDNAQSFVKENVPTRLPHTTAI